MAVYDSEKVRQSATLMKQLAGSVGAAVKPGLGSAAQYIVGFNGRTAQAMAERIDELIRTSGNLQAELDALAHSVSAYADMLEEADQQLAREL